MYESTSEHVTSSDLPDSNIDFPSERGEINMEKLLSVFMFLHIYVCYVVLKETKNE